MDTRGSILCAAFELFLAQGYQRTTLRCIAERVELSKAAILYHFPSKADLAATLIEPFLDDLEAVLDRVAVHAPSRSRWRLVEGMLDVYLTHRRVLGLLSRDPAPFLQGAAFHRLMAVSARANAILGGPHAELTQRVRAAQVTAMITDPVLHLGEVAPDALRAEILAGVRRLLGSSGRTRGGAADRGPGRPRVLTESQLQTARQLLAQGKQSVTEIADRYGVSRATLYRHLKGSLAT